MNILEISAVQTQSVSAGDFLVFDTTNLKCGLGIYHADGSNNVHIYTKGIYVVTFNADVIPTGAGEITVTLENNGVIVNSATFTGVAGIGENIALAYPIAVMKSCECVDNRANLKVRVSADATIINAHLMIKD